MTKLPSVCRVLAPLVRSGFLKACVGNVYPLSCPLLLIHLRLQIGPPGINAFAQLI